MGEAIAPARRMSGRGVWFSAKVARRICDRVESGESVRSICADPGMPHRSTVQAWYGRFPAFRARVERARSAAGWHMRGGHPPKWCEATAAEVFARLCEGETLTDICADPAMPAWTTVWRWRARYPQFAEALELARQVQAERFCDLGWKIASEVTPADAYATHVKLTHLRWTAGALAPARFGRFKAVQAETEALAEAAEAPPATTKIVFTARHFELEELPDGTKRVVALERCPETGRLMREKEYRPFREG